MLSSSKKDDSLCKIFLKEFLDASSTKKCEEDKYTFFWKVVDLNKDEVQRHESQSSV